MKTYLLNPSEEEMLYGVGDRPPLSLLYLASWNREIFKNNSFKIIDLNHTKKIDALKEIEKERPDYLGINVYSSTLNQALKLNRLIKKISPNTKTIAGGYHPSAIPEDLFDFDFIVKGEGERGLEKILEGDSEKIIEAQKILNLDLIPYPARDLLYMGLYNMKQEGKRTAILTSSRGCPFSCNFCGGKVMNKSMRQRSVDNIIGEIKDLKNNYFYESLYFIDDSLTSNTNFVYDFSEEIAQFRMPFRITTRADLITEEKLRALKEGGLDLISIGVETGNNYMLQLLNKKETLEEIFKAFDICKKLNIKTKAFFVVGLPGESGESISNTLKIAKKLNPNYADFYIFTPYPGSEFWNNPQKYGIKIKNKNFDNYLQAKKDYDVKCNIDLETMSSNQIEWWHKWIMNEWKEFKKNGI